jgi:hypothetical protein
MGRDTPDLGDRKVTTAEQTNVAGMSQHAS